MTRFLPYPTMNPTNDLWLRAQSSYWFAWAVCPVVRVSGELMNDPTWASRTASWYHRAYHNFDSDYHLLAVLPLHWVIQVWAWWFRSRRRYVIEIWMLHHVAWLSEGGYFRDWRWRPFQHWTFRYSRWHPDRGLRQ